jgi:hypothetical protein
MCVLQNRLLIEYLTKVANMSITTVCLKSLIATGSLFVLIGCGGGDAHSVLEKRIWLEGNLDSRLALPRTAIDAAWFAAAEKAATTSIQLRGADDTTFDLVLRFTFRSENTWIVHATTSGCSNSSELELKFESDGLRDKTSVATLAVFDCGDRHPAPISLDLGDFSQFAAPFQITGLAWWG